MEMEVPLEVVGMSRGEGVRVDEGRFGLGGAWWMRFLSSEAVRLILGIDACSVFGS